MSLPGSISEIALLRIIIPAFVYLENVYQRTDNSELVAEFLVVVFTKMVRWGKA